MGNYCATCEMCSGGGGTVVGGSSDSGVSTGAGFQRSYDDLTP